MNRTSALNLFSLCGSLALAAVLSTSSVKTEPEKVPIELSSARAPVTETAFRHYTVSQRTERDPLTNPILSCEIISRDYRYDLREISRLPEPPRPEVLSHYDWRDPMLNPLLL